MKRLTFLGIISLIILIALAGCSNNDKDMINKTYETNLSPNEIDNEAFGELFPLEYQSYLKNNEMSNENTFYGGSVPDSKFGHNKEPYLPILFNNYGFAEEYNEERGHTYALEDVTKIARINDNSIGSCMTCKTTAVPTMINEMGDDYWSANFRKEILPRVHELGGDPIGCSDCHEPTTMELRVTRPSFVEAMARKGVDVTKATKNEMRSYVCGQCHVEYYFEPEKKKVTYPWDNGFKPEEMYQYYEEQLAEADGFKKDWIHGVSGAPMLKSQHPEFETWSEGTHGKAGVSCSDCHMPYERTDGKKKISSHHWTSPLKSIDNSCRTCHGDKSADYLRDRVKDIQDKNVESLHKAQDISITAHYYVNKMITAGAPEAKITEAQKLVREGQWFWDIVAAENSSGFHNPQGSMASLNRSIEASNRAIILATEELVKLGVSVEELNSEIEKVKKAVYDEPDNFKKSKQAQNQYFPTPLQ